MPVQQECSIKSTSVKQGAVEYQMRVSILSCNVKRGEFVGVGTAAPCFTAYNVWQLALITFIVFVAKVSCNSLSSVTVDSVHITTILVQSKVIRVR